MTAMTTTTGGAACVVCGAKLQANTTGRPRRYCTARCRQSAYRARTGHPDAVGPAPYTTGSFWAMRVGRAQDVLRTVPDQCVQTVVTSPPYWQLRDYGHDNQLGLERTVQEYVTNLVDVLRQVRRVLRPDGTLWLNLGDTYAGRTDTSTKQHPAAGTATASQHHNVPTLQVPHDASRC